MAKTATQTKEDAPQGETKRDKFTRVIGGRVGNAIQKIRLIKNGANTASYDFTPEDVEKMKAALVTEVAEVIEAFENALEGKETKSGGNGFTF